MLGHGWLMSANVLAMLFYYWGRNNHTGICNP